MVNSNKNISDSSHRNVSCADQRLGNNKSKLNEEDFQILRKVEIENYKSYWSKNIKRSHNGFDKK